MAKIMRLCCNQPRFLHLKPLQITPLFLKGSGFSRNSSTTVTVSKISPNVTLRQVARKSESSPNNPHPLVLMYTWLNASENATGKYTALYHGIGLDVLTIKGKLKHFLWPPTGVKLSQEVFQFLHKRPLQEPLFIHAFSVGAYNFAIALQESQKSLEIKGVFRDKVCAQVFDSIVIGTYDNMTEGIALSLPRNKLLRSLVMNMMGLYYNITRRVTRDQYDKLVNTFKMSPITVPTLVFYSHNDPMCHVPTIQAMVKDWQRGFPDMVVRAKSWKESPHAGHLRRHRDEYLKEWEAVMKQAAPDRQNRFPCLNFITHRQGSSFYILGTFNTFPIRMNQFCGKYFE